MDPPPSSCFITGYSIRAPKSGGPLEFFTNLRDGRDMTSETHRYPKGYMGLPPRTGTLPVINRFDHEFFNYSVKQTGCMDIIIRLLLEVTQEALMDAKLPIRSLRGSRTGVYIGHCFSDYMNGACAREQASGYEVVNGAHTMAANKLSFFYDLKGPSLAVDTACSSSMTALDMAFRDLQSGVVERAIVGGVSLTIDPNKNRAFNAFSMLSPTGLCHSFDERADGYCRSEGIGVVVLESTRVCEHGYARILGTGTNSDGYKDKGITYPSVGSQAALMRDVFQRYGIDPAAIGYVEAHGTGTVAGDANELQALESVFSSQHGLWIGSVKSNMGHAEGASGIMSVIKTLLMFEHRTLLPNLHFRSTAHDQILSGKFKVVSALAEWSPQPVAISNYGFGGSNGFAVLAPGNVCFSATRANDEPRFAFGGRRDLHLPQGGGWFLDQLRLQNDSFFKVRLCGDRTERVQPSTPPPKICFICDGQGAQWSGMGKRLMQSSPVFAATIRRLAEHAPGLDLAALYEAGDQWYSKELTCIGVVSYQIALVNTLRDMGLEPDFFFGHSLGEVVCGYLAGLQTEAQTMQIARVRAQLAELIRPEQVLLVSREVRPDLQRAPIKRSSGEPYVYYAEPGNQKTEGDLVFSMRGLMMAVGLPAADIEAAIAELGLSETRCACLNSPSGQTVSGSEAEVLRLQRHLRERHGEYVFCQELPTSSVAYHSPMLGVFRADLADKLSHILGQGDVAPLPPAWISTSGGSQLGAAYFTSNILEPVLFQQAVEQLPAGTVCIELGPDSGLLSQVKRVRRDLVTVPLVKRDHGEDLRPARAELFLRGARLFAGDVSRGQREPLAARHPDLWDHSSDHTVLTHEDFPVVDGRERAIDDAGLQEVTLSLQGQWSSLRGHRINGRVLFPATGYLFLLWQERRFVATEFRDLRIHSAVLLAEQDLEVRFRISVRGGLAEVHHDSRLVASCEIREPGAAASPQQKVQRHEENKAVSSGQFYAYIRKFGYEYRDAYRRVTAFDHEHNVGIMAAPEDWISYLDGCLHPLVLQSDALLLPVGFGRVVLQEQKLEHADQQVWLAPHSRQLGNRTALFEDWHMEAGGEVLGAASVVRSRAGLLRYGSNHAEDAKYLGQALQFEGTTFSLACESAFTLEVASWLAPLLEQAPSSPVTVCEGMPPSGVVGVVVTDRRLEAARLVEVMSFGGRVWVYRARPSSTAAAVASPQWVTDWQAVRAAVEPVWWTNKLVGEGVLAATRALLREGREPAVHGVYVEEQAGVIALAGDLKARIVAMGMRLNHVTASGDVGCPIERQWQRPQAPSSKFSLVVKQPGNLESCAWVQCGGGTRVDFAALNFRDTMRAFGKLKERDMSVGLEFAGRSEAGQRVFGVGRRTIGSHCEAVYTYPTPESFTSEEAATISVAYLTAYHALFDKAGLVAGQSVLIHAGAGGVGMASIYLCQKRGVEVYATCSEGKRQFLKDRFGLRGQQLGPSRSEAFKAWILEQTEGRGVDAVLNSLAGELLLASLGCVAPGGSFCEIGKYDVMQRSKIGMELLERNVSFHVIDLLPLLHDKRWDARWDAHLRQGFAAGEIVPLPSYVFEAGRVTEAFRFMSQGKHTGKVLVAFSESFAPPAEPRYFTRGRHLITGGLGGMALELAKRLGDRGCEELVLVGRSGVTSGWQRRQLANIACRVTLVQSSTESLTSQGPLEAIWHTATSYCDAQFANMDPERWDAVVRAKVLGLQHLRRLYPETRIVCFSSVAAAHGNAGQTNYCFANEGMELLGRGSSSTLCIQWGAVDNVGKVAEMGDAQGYGKYRPESVERLLDFLDEVCSEVGVVARYALAEACGAEKKQQETGAITFGDVQARLALVLGGAAEDYNEDTPLRSYGVDSLSQMELMSWANRHTTKQVSPSFLDNATPQSLADHIAKFSKAGCGASAERTTVSNTAAKTPVSETSKPVPQLPMQTGDLVPKTLHVNDLVEPGMQPVVGESGPPRLLGRSTSQSLGKPDQAPTVTLREARGRRKPPPQHDVFTVALPPQLTTELFERFESAFEARPQLLVLEQEDPAVFNEGLPLGRPEEWPRNIDRFVALCEQLSNFQGVIACHVRGKVRGGGLAFPAAATVCYCTEDSSFGLPEVSHGLVPGVVSAVLARKVQPARLRPYILTGEPFDAATAVSLGLCHKVLPADKWPSALRRLTDHAPACSFVQRTFGSQDPRAMGTIMGEHLLGGSVHAPAEGQHGAAQCVISLGWKGQVAVLTMKDDEGYNTFSSAMASQLEDLLDELSEARCIVLHSALPSVFHVGANPVAYRQMQGEARCLIASKLKANIAPWLRLFRLGKPVIAVLHGKVYGGGLPIALWSDYRVAAADVDLHYGNISRGMSPLAQLSEQLKRHLPPGALMDFYLGNAHWDASRGRREGMLQLVCPSKDEALREALSLADFVARQPESGVLKTLSVVRLEVSEEVVNLEAWLLAGSVADGQVFTHAPAERDASWCPAATSCGGDDRDHHGCGVSAAVAAMPAALAVPAIGAHPARPREEEAFGIVAMAPYVSDLALSSEEMEANGVDAGRFMQKAVALCDVNEDAVSMALSAVQRLLEILPVDVASIGRLEVGTESNIDMAKSIKTYLMQLFPEHRELEGADNVSACYGGTAALLNALAWLRSGAADERRRYAIVVATDTAIMDSSDTHWLGCGAMAMLVGPNPAIEIRPERVTYMKHSEEFFQPRHSKRLTPYLDGKGSMECYISALKYTSEQMKARHGISLSSVDKVAVHGGMCKSVIVKACNEWGKLEGLSRAKLLEKYESSGRHAELLGAQYTASLYFNLHSALEHSATLPSKMLLFSYGSGSAATLLSARVHRLPEGFAPLTPTLAARRPLTFAEASEVLGRHLAQSGRGCAERPLAAMAVRSGAYYAAAVPSCGAGRRYVRAPLLEATSSETPGGAGELHTRSAAIASPLGSEPSSPAAACGGEGPPLTQQPPAAAGATAPSATAAGAAASAAAVAAAAAVVAVAPAAVVHAAPSPAPAAATATSMVVPAAASRAARSKGADTCTYGLLPPWSSTVEVVQAAWKEFKSENITQLTAEDERLDGRLVTVNGRSCVNFGLCSYLGLEMDPRLREAAKSAMDRFGLQFSESRAYLSSPLYTELEELMSSVFGGPTIVGQSTTLIHLSVLPAFVTEKCKVLLDLQAHASIKTAAKVLRAHGTIVETVNHNSVSDIERFLQEATDAGQQHVPIWYLCDGVYSMYGDFAPLQELAQLQARFPNFHLYVDDCHAVSWYGRHGHGFALECLQPLNERTIVVGGLSKAFGSGGGFAVFSCEEQRQRALTGIGPMVFGGPVQIPVLGALIASAKLHLSDEIVTMQRELMLRIDHCCRRCDELGLPLVSHHRIPIRFIGVGLPRVAATLVRKLREAGFLVNVAMFPAVPMQKPGLRFTLTRHQTLADIDALLETMAELLPPLLAQGGRSLADVRALFGLEDPAAAAWKGDEAQSLDGSTRAGATTAPTDFEASPTKASGLQLEHHDTIGSVSATEWDALLGDQGTFDHASLAAFEAACSPEYGLGGGWKFDYYLVRDTLRGGRAVLATFFTTMLSKDDALADTAVSELCERLRERDPLYATSIAMQTGTLPSMGNPLYLDTSSSAAATQALRLLVRAAHARASDRGAKVTSFMPIPARAAEMPEVLVNEGFTESKFPVQYRVECMSETAWLQSCTKNVRQNLRKYVLRYREQWSVQIASSSDLDSAEHSRLVQLHRNCAERAFQLNTFPLPDSLIRELAARPAWELVVLRRAASQEIAGFVLCCARRSAYYAFVCGLDYTLLQDHVYLQLLYRAICRARELELPCELGVTADQSKRKLGAQGRQHLMFVQTDATSIDGLSREHRHSAAVVASGGAVPKTCAPEPGQAQDQLFR